MYMYPFVCCRCCSSKDEDDFRSLFDNFVQDLLSTLGLPEWPASEVLLTLLGVLLVCTCSSNRFMYMYMYIYEINSDPFFPKKL